jgi:hypothetical protein
VATGFAKDKTALVIDRGSGIARATSDDTEQGVLFALTNSQAVIAHLIDRDLTYSPDPLEPTADGEVLICCAQPGTDIVLDM